jgi:hypothetical protein
MRDTISPTTSSPGSLRKKKTNDRYRVVLQGKRRQSGTTGQVGVVEGEQHAESFA